MSLIHKEKIGSNNIVMTEYLNIMEKIDILDAEKEVIRKKKRAEKQRRYRATKKGQEAVDRQNAKAKVKTGYKEKMRKNAKEYYEYQIDERIKSGEKIKRRNIRTKKEMEEKVRDWNTEKVNTLKSGIYISYRKLKLQKKQIIFMPIKSEPFIDVGYCENKKMIFVGMKYINKNPSIYGDGNDQETLVNVAEEEPTHEKNEDGVIIVSFD